MPSLSVSLSAAVFDKVSKAAKKEGKTPNALIAELVEEAVSSKVLS
jgi:hypothetical protein